MTAATSNAELAELAEFEVEHKKFCGFRGFSVAR
jgi:hypothetical protein